jgi:hypothetical protein
MQLQLPIGELAASNAWITQLTLQISYLTKNSDVPRAKVRPSL